MGWWGTRGRPLIGMFPAVYGLIGLYTWMLWVAADELGQNRYAAFRLIGVLVVLQLIFGMIGGFYRGWWRISRVSHWALSWRHRLRPADCSGSGGGSGGTEAVA